MITNKIPEQFSCELCLYDTSNKKDYNKHLSTAKHLNNMSGYTKSPKKDYLCGICNKNYKSRYGLWNHKKTCIINYENNVKLNCEKVCEKVANVATKITPKFLCEICQYNTSNKSDYTKHVNTNKHKNKIILQTENNTNISIVESSSNEIKVMTGLMVEIVKSNNELQKQNQDFQKQTLDLRKQNQDLQKQVLEICQKIQQPSNTIIHTNSHNNINNKTFNLQFFLNEECKDAMNMSEFINSIQIKISDLENIGKVGYVEGISNIIIKELNETQINKRPVHCSDSKRETLYIKDENKWEKDTDETKKMVKAVRDVNKKNYQLLANWKDIRPNCTDSTSNQSNEFTNLVSEVVMDNDETNVKKVIKRVAKQVVIEK